MQKQTSIYIPKPCHEDWNKMTPSQQGKFCGACSKQVIDFSLMSDNQILNILSGQTGKLCGRFDAEQLQRPLIETKIKKQKSWWMALTMPLLFLFERSEAQKISLRQKHHVVQSIDTSDIIVGAVAIIEHEKIIIGSVVDDNNKPLPYVSIFQKGTKHGTTSDSLGNFSLNVTSVNNSATITASCIGFKAIEKQIKLNEPKVIIAMPLEPALLSDVVVISYPVVGRLGGAVSVCTRVSAYKKLDTSFKKLIGISNVYPNPTTRGSSIYLKIKAAGDYQVQLFSNQSALILAEEITTSIDKSTSAIQLPSNIPAGIYYLRLINEQTKKQYTEKLIIQ